MEKGDDKKTESKLKTWPVVLIVFGLGTLSYLLIRDLLFVYVGIFSVIVWIWLILILLFILNFVLAWQNIITGKLIWVLKFGWLWLILTILILLNIWIKFIPYDDTQNQPTNSQSSSNNMVNTKTTKAEPGFIVPQTTFTDGLGAWYEHIWYKAASSEGEVTTGVDGVTFKALKSNSRSGIMLDVNKDVSDFSKVVIEADIVVKLHTLSGTGWNGREAPVGIAVSYQDVNGTEYNLLGEDPKASNQMFWRGFYYLDPIGTSGSVNGVKVAQNQPYNFSFDLMTLNPKPKIINYIGIEGAGWQSREGSIRSISLYAE